MRVSVASLTVWRADARQRQRAERDGDVERRLLRRGDRSRAAVPGGRHPGARPAAAGVDPPDSALRLQSRAHPRRQRRRSAARHSTSAPEPSSPASSGRSTTPSARYTILPDPSAVGDRTTAARPRPRSSDATAHEFTVGSYNIERFFDDCRRSRDRRAGADSRRLRQPAGARPRSASETSSATRTSSASSRSRTSATLQALADADQRRRRRGRAARPATTWRTWSRATTSAASTSASWSRPPQSSGTVPRVTVTAVVQEHSGTLFTNPDTSTETLNDRPPLRLTAVVNFANGRTLPAHSDRQPPALAQRRQRARRPDRTAGRRRGSACAPSGRRRPSTSPTWCRPVSSPIRPRTHHPGRRLQRLRVQRRSGRTRWA